eukprot:TRINITY_DN1982_c0_g1_i1.p1 TRINITY_DN1982_c0_g1~~TRINITY_DN1982_c0_g1_i1.p1  ORF type:complete len:137 (-),score=32.82 TRINITY_DN1982_c0_g1_i1:69-437(-)
MADDYKKGAIEIQNKFFDITRQLNSVKSTTNLNERERAKGLQTQKDLNEFPEDVKSYKPVGRMFLQTPLKDLKAELSGQISVCEAEIKKLQLREVQLNKNMKEAQDVIRQMLSNPNYAKFFQ